MYHEPTESGPLGLSGTSQYLQTDKSNEYETQYGICKG